jgi:glutathione peroxidase
MDTNIDYSTTLETIQGQQTTMEPYRGNVMLIVNTASECGLTGQFDGLQRLWEEFGEAGFVVLGFPCNQFGGQDPGSNGEIASFCQLNYGVSFPMHARTDVNGPGAHPLFKLLKQAAPGLLGSQPIKWNFTKFLVGADGTILQRFSPKTQPSEMRASIEAALAGPGASVGATG